MQVASVPLEQFKCDINDHSCRFVRCGGAAQLVAQLGERSVADFREAAVSNVFGNACDSVKLSVLVSDWKGTIMNPANRAVRTLDALHLIVLSFRLFFESL